MDSVALRFEKHGSAFERKSSRAEQISTPRFVRPGTLNPSRRKSSAPLNDADGFAPVPMLTVMGLDGTSAIAGPVAACPPFVVQRPLWKKSGRRIVPLLKLTAKRFELHANTVVRLSAERWKFVGPTVVGNGFALANIPAEPFTRKLPCGDAAARSKPKPAPNITKSSLRRRSRLFPCASNDSRFAGWL